MTEKGIEEMSVEELELEIARLNNRPNRSPRLTSRIDRLKRERSFRMAKAFLAVVREDVGEVYGLALDHVYYKENDPSEHTVVVSVWAEDDDKVVLRNSNGVCIFNVYIEETYPLPGSKKSGTPLLNGYTVQVFRHRADAQAWIDEYRWKEEDRLPEDDEPLPDTVYLAVRGGPDDERMTTYENRSLRDVYRLNDEDKSLVTVREPIKACFDGQDIMLVTWCDTTDYRTKMPCKTLALRTHVHLPLGVTFRFLVEGMCEDEDDRDPDREYEICAFCTEEEARTWREEGLTKK